jgi:hypothetical protein
MVEDALGDTTASPSSAGSVNSSLCLLVTATGRDHVAAGREAPVGGVALRVGGQSLLVLESCDLDLLNSLEDLRRSDSACPSASEMLVPDREA